MKRWELEESAQERIFAESGKKAFNPMNVRARGIWRDGAGWVYNAGNKCWFINEKGQFEQAESVIGERIYSSGVALPAPAAAPLTDEEGEALLQMLTSRPWSLDGMGELVLGETVSALLAGALHMSPHVWITAPQGTGKTKLMDDVTALLRPFSTVNEGVPTEAAVRQRLQGDALPWLNDEMEAGDSKAATRNIGKVIDLMRSASYGKAPMSKGGADGTARLFPMKCGFCFFSVVDSLSRDSDTSRCLQLRLTRRKNQRELWKYQEAGRNLTQQADFHSRLIARILKILPVITRNVASLTDYLRDLDGVDARKGELFAVLMACRYALTNSTPLTAEQMQHAADILRAYDYQEERESDFSRCLTVLLNHQIDVYNAGKMTVSEACRLMSTMCEGETKDHYSRALQIAGLRWRDDWEALQVDPRADRMKRIYKDSQWSNGKISSVLAEGADPRGGKAGANANGIWYQSAKVGGATPTRCIMIPTSLVF